jgi:excisionase family DNA binding protein
MEINILQIPESKFNELTSKLDRLEQSQNRIFEIATDGTLYTSEEVQKLLGVSQKTLQTYRDKYLIEFIQIGGLVRYSRKAVSEFMERFAFKVKA